MVSDDSRTWVKYLPPFVLFVRWGFKTNRVNVKDSCPIPFHCFPGDWRPKANCIRSAEQYWLTFKYKSYIVLSGFGMDVFFGFQMYKRLNLSRSHYCVQSLAYGQDWQGLPLEGFGSFWTIGHPKFQYHIKSKMVSNFLGLWAGLAVVALGEHWPPLPIPRAGKASSGQQRGKEFQPFVVWSRNFLYDLSERSCQDFGFMFLFKFYRIKVYTSCPFLFPTIPASHPDSLHYILWGDVTMGPVASA